MTSSEDETEAAARRHRSSEPRVCRWRRRQDDEVEELDPADVAKLLRRAADADRERQGDPARTPTKRDPERDASNRRVISDALVQGLADPTPPDDRRHLLPRRRAEGEPPNAPVERAMDDRPASDHASLEARLRAAEERAEEYAAKLRHARDDLAAADERARELAAELASRDADHDERAHALASERDDVEGRVRALTEASATAAEERATLEQLVADQARMLEEAQADRAGVHHQEQPDEHGA
jgi:hypothetical protein